MPRRLGPVLALLVVIIRRRAYRALRGEVFGQVYGIRTIRVNADGHIGHESNGHASIQCSALGSI